MISSVCPILRIQMMGLSHKIKEHISGSCIRSENKDKKASYFISSLPWDSMFYYIFAVSRDIAVGRETIKSVNSALMYTVPYWTL